jgi:hypothetical protein
MRRQAAAILLLAETIATTSCWKREPTQSSAGFWGPKASDSTDTARRKADYSFIKLAPKLLTHVQDRLIEVNGHWMETHPTGGAVIARLNVSFREACMTLPDRSW